MGAPKQKWTSEEEAALKAGIRKHGAGRWSNILRDPQFGDILKSRSNVDLKDKWRNLCCMASGSGSRSKSSTSYRSTESAPKNNEEVVKTVDPKDCGSIVHTEIGKLFEINVTSMVAEKDVAADAFENHVFGLADDEVSGTVDKDNIIVDVVEKDVCFDVEKHIAVDAIPLAVDDSGLAGPWKANSSNIVRLDDLILEAVAKLKEPRGSSQRMIAQYIEGNYSVALDLKRTLAANLKLLTEEGRLINVRDHYRLAPKLVPSNTGKELPTIGSKLDFLGRTIPKITKAQIDAELDKMKSMTPQEAAAAAAKAVAEAEALMAEAEAAVKEAEEAEAEAEAARLFAEASDKSSTYFGIVSR